MCYPIRGPSYLYLLSFNWFIKLSASIVIGQSNYFDFGFMTVKYNENHSKRNNQTHQHFQLNPLTSNAPVCVRTRLHCFKKLQLSQSREHCLNYQLGPFTRKSFKLRYPINTKISAIFAEYQRFNLDKNKNDHF